MVLLLLLLLVVVVVVVVVVVLPPGLANWPADVDVESTDFIEL